MSNENIIKYVEKGYSYSETAKRFKITRSTVAGVIWRHKNPGMWKKGVSKEQYAKGLRSLGFVSNK